MNYDEFAFFNQQLGAMLRDGIPLEGALKQLAAGMRDGQLKHECALLEKDLAQGTPLKEALGQRKLPEFYVKMVEIGVRSNDLPGTLTLLADHYHRVNALWTRLKGLMVYPVIVVTVSLGLTLVLSIAFSKFLDNFFDQLATPPPVMLVSAWIPPILLAIVLVFGLCAMLIPSWRSRLRWRFPAFREASLAQLASSIALMLRNGTTLSESLALAEMIESDTPASKALASWRHLLEGGQGKPGNWPATNPFPPLFVWLVQQSREDPAAGFEKAAEVYRGRASYRIELALYGALPISILLLGLMIFWQAAPMLRTLVWFMNSLGGNMEG